MPGEELNPPHPLSLALDNLPSSFPAAIDYFGQLSICRLFDNFRPVHDFLAQGLLSSVTSKRKLGQKK